MNPTPVSPLPRAWDIHQLRYSAVWEDFSRLDESLRLKNVPHPKLLSIGSAGDNSLSLLRFNPQKLVILDLSPAQMALVEFKIAGLKILPFASFLEVLGYTGTAEQRMVHWPKLTEHMSAQSQNYWHDHLLLFKNGVHDSGRLDSYFKKFRQAVIPKVWSQDQLAQLLTSRDLIEQRKNWQQGNLHLLNSAVREFFSKTALSLEGRDASQFAHVTQEDLGPVFLKRFLTRIENQLIANNPYMYSFFTGQPLQGPHALPLYREEEFNLFKTRLDCIELRTCTLEDFLASSSEDFDFMNLSDIFEYLSEKETHLLFSALSRRLSAKGLLAYWTLLLDRQPTSGLRVLEKESRQLSAADQTWFYSGFWLSEKQFN